MKSRSFSTCSRSTPGIGRRRWQLLVFGSLHGVSELEKSSGCAGQHFDAARMNCDIVLDANSSHAFDVDSRFQSHYAARSNLLFLSPADARGLVNLDPQAVTGAMHKVPAQATALQHPPRRSIHLPGGDSCSKSLEGCLLGLVNCFVPAPYFRRRRTHQRNGGRATISPSASPSRCRCILDRPETMGSKG